MKTINIYQCEICGLKYKIMEDAIKCEERGPGRSYPIGCVYGNTLGGRTYGSATFAVAINNIVGHNNRGFSWVCRESLIDSLDTNMCQGSGLNLKKLDCPINPFSPHFKRMISWLKNQQIEITIWDGEKPVSYATFMKNYEKENVK